MLTGSNDNEAGIVSGFVLAAVKWAKAQPADKLPKEAQSLFKLIDWFRDGDDFLINSIRGVLHFIEDGVFNCPASTAAAARARAGVPVWRYRFMARYPNTLLEGQGAYHVGDVPIVMGATERKPTASKNTAEEEQMIKNTMTAWASFAKDPENGLSKLGWPKYNPQGMIASFICHISPTQILLGKTLVRLGYQNQAAASFSAPTEYDSNCKNLKWAPASGP
jgi:carboxylesterase type B